MQTTRWSLILRAQKPDAAGAEALGQLLAAYWQPVYVFFRRLGADAEAAADLTQGLYADLLQRGDLATASPERGRFRAFLRTCARHWWSNQREHAAAQKRGGGARPVAFELDDVETWLGERAVDGDDAAALFEQRWAQTLLDRVLWRLQQEELAAGRPEQFARLRECLDGGPPPEPWAALAARLQTTEGALRVAAHRLKQRFRTLVAAEVRETLPDDCAPGEELQQLLAALQARARGTPPREIR